MKISNYLFIIIVSVLLHGVIAWDSEQLEVFDVVDEVKVNFYDLLSITQDATSAQIRSAFKTLSLKLHPDKNLDTDTSVQFRNLVSVYDILKSSSKRKYYDEVLINGLPNWRSAVYYYRYVRKMGLAETCLILFVLITVGQYAVYWAAYFEKKFTLAENTKKRKIGRKAKLVDDDLYYMDIPKPSFFDTLPFQIPKFFWICIISIPSTVGLLRSAVAQQIEEATKPPPEPEPEPVKIKTVRKRNKFVVPEGPNFETTTTAKSDGTESSSTVPIVTGGLWTDDDLDELIRLVKKFPQGFPKRWENIAESLGRSVPEVTYMSNKMKESGYRPTSEKDDEDIQPVKVKQKTKKSGIELNGVDKWNQIQQKALEDALAKYPKGCLDRWDRIEDHVPGKTKKECMMRFKYLSEIVKQQKHTNEETTSNDVADNQNIPVD